ncbi:hypothetical protein POTOM_052419 [Populus tomentosa]|uniref:Major facilitator superfamily (MFS) profile domain-containing protein n=1 Tax=Populus tomentosa TaxID=118781 RepID=A0A8X7Y7Z0_POPTO|nr:hypothetical protein POTOM_052419 [Populus tomentosa]
MSSTTCVGVKLKLCTLNSVIRTVGGLYNLCWSGSLMLFFNTIISDWDLECASSFIKGLPASSFFLGCLLGGFVLGTLVDTSLGRKNLPTLSCLTMSIASLMTIFSTNLWIYSAFRFLSGFGRAAIGATALVLATEKVGSKWRGQMGTIAGVSFAFGLLSLPVLESPRWLFLQGRKEAAMAILKRLGFGIGIVYYSMPLAVGNLGFNIYLSVAFNGLAEIPSYIIFSFIEVVLSGLELVSYFSACTAFIMLMIYILELFPTCVRNGASLMVRQAPVFGAVFSPILISAGRSNKVLSYGVFGLVILCSSVFVFCLPETRGVALSDTMDEQEEKEQLAM